MSYDLTYFTDQFLEVGEYSELTDTLKGTVR